MEVDDDDDDWEEDDDDGVKGSLANEAVAIFVLQKKRQRKKIEGFWMRSEIQLGLVGLEKFRLKGFANEMWHFDFSFTRGLFMVV